MLILWIVLILLILFMTILVIYLGLPQSQTTTTVSNNPCLQNLQNLPQVGDTGQFTQCNTFTNDVPIQQYYDRVNNWTVANVSGTNIPSAEQICSQLCEQITLPITCESQSQEYLSCMKTLTPINCSDAANPVARYGQQPYYVIGVGNVSCY